WRFRRDRPDLVVVLHVNEEVYPLAYWINRDAVVTFTNSNERYAFLSAHPVKVEDTQHAVVLPLKVAQYAGGSAVAPRMIYEVKVDELAAIRARFADWIDHAYVVFQTGGGKTLFWRDWPVEHYVTLIRWFSDYCPLDKSARYVALQLKRSHPQQPPSARDMAGISCDEVKSAIAGMLECSR